jgi:hypothetical protein
MVPNRSVYLQTTLEAEAYLAGQNVLEEQTLNKETSLICRAGTRKSSVSRRDAQNFRTKVNLNREE